MSTVDRKLNPVLRDDQTAIAAFLTKAFETDDLKVILEAIKTSMRAQNVVALAEAAGMRRDRLYRTFNGTVDPSLGRVLGLLAAMNVQLVARPLSTKPRPPRPNLGRPRKEHQQA